MPQPWSALFQINRAPMIELNLEGISQTMADRAPAEGINSITWILRHLIFYRRETLRVVRPVPFTSSRPEPRTLPELLAALDELQIALGEAFDAVEDWAAARNHPAMDAPMPLDQIVGTFLSHEAYHIGQIALARRLLGLPGVLKDPAERVHA